MQYKKLSNNLIIMRNCSLSIIFEQINAKSTKHFSIFLSWCKNIQHKKYFFAIIISLNKNFEHLSVVPWQWDSDYSFLD